MKKEPFILFPFSRMGMVGLVVLMLSISACNPGPTIAGADEPDPVVSDPPGGVICREVAPNLTNPAITGWNETHEICLPESPKSRTGVLWVFLPGTGGTPDDYNTLTRTAAEAGLYAITLQYPNDRSVNLQHCPLDPDNDCHEKVRLDGNRHPCGAARRPIHHHWLTGGLHRWRSVLHQPRIETNQHLCSGRNLGLGPQRSHPPPALLTTARELSSAAIRSPS